MTAAVMTNDYWEAVRHHVHPTGSLWGTPEVGSLPVGRGPDAYRRWAKDTPQRHEHVHRYSWTITDPDTVAFVAQHSGGRLVDPMAGTGWWAHLLGQHGVDVVSYDVDPVGNHWHKGADLHAPVVAMEAVDAVALHPDRTLFLSWPPYDKPDGADTIRAYRGDRLILIHEGEGGCIGDDDMFAELATNWVEVASHVPVQWFGLHDRIDVYTRKEAR